MPTTFYSVYATTGVEMRLDGRNLILSASDLMRFQECAHATALDRRLALGENLAFEEVSEGAQLLQKRGDAHEAQYLENLKASENRIDEIDKDKLTLKDAVTKTTEALQGGSDYIFQAAFSLTPWAGYSDFLERVEYPSKFGPFSYEIIDTKLKRSPRRY